MNPGSLFNFAAKMERQADRRSLNRQKVNGQVRVRRLVILTMTGCWWIIFKAIIRPCDGASGQRPPCERPSTIRNCYTVIDVLGTQEDKHLRRETPNNYMGNARWTCCSPTASRSSRGLDPNASMHRQRQDSIGCRDDGARKYSSSICQWRAEGPGGGRGESLE